MKKLIFISFLFLSSLTLNAQRCIVLDFKIGENVTAEDVDAISYEFRSSFNPSCYTVEDYLKLKNLMKDLGYDPTTIRKEQIRKLGRDLVAVIAVYGTLEKFMNEYSLDVLVMDVSTGTTVIHESSTFQQSEYHSHPRSVSKGIATKLCNASKPQIEKTLTRGELKLDEGRYVGDIVDGKPYGKGSLFYKEDDEKNIYPPIDDVCVDP